MDSVGETVARMECPGSQSTRPESPHSMPAWRTDHCQPSRGTDRIPALEILRRLGPSRCSADSNVECLETPAGIWQLIDARAPCQSCFNPVPPLREALFQGRANANATAHSRVSRSFVGSANPELAELPTLPSSACWNPAARRHTMFWAMVFYAIALVHLLACAFDFKG